MYRNSLTPSKLFGIILLLFATAGALMWAGCLIDVETSAFDVAGLILLGSTLGLLVLGLLFLRRAKWVRLPTSILLHLLVLVVLATLFFTVPGESLQVQMTIGAFTFLVASLLFTGILALHNDAMKTDLTRGPAGHLMSRRLLFVAGGCVLLFAALAAWQIVPLLVAKPTITVDYVAQVNQANRPVDYDPNRNAGPHYEKFFAQLTPLPDVLTDKWKSWPTDLSTDELKALEEWAPVNEPVLAFLAQAARCPYWWYVINERGSPSNPQIPAHERVRLCAWSTILLAKYKASQGDVDSAIQLLADLHMCGVHQIVSGMSVTQMAGLGLCEVSSDAVLTVLDHCTATQNTLQRTLDAFVARMPQIRLPRFSQVEYACAQDQIQHAFTDDNHGNGRLIPAQIYEFKKNHISFYREPMSYPDAVWTCLTHPSRQETILLFDEYFATAERLASQTPWELYRQGTTYEECVTSLLSHNYFLQDIFGSMGRCIRVGWHGRLSGEGAITTLAILTYQAKEGRLPGSLRQLVDAGLLASVPLDPYSGEPFVYRVTSDTFTLYSVGEDFVDDAGVPCEWGDEMGGDHVFWPIPRAEVEAEEQET